MLDKMISVSPPQKGEAPDSKLADSKNFRGTSKSEYKKDFEKALKKKEVTEKKDELRAEQKDGKKESKDIKNSKTPGGTKKKVVADDDKMVSNLMASNESKVEIPVSKIEQPAQIEVNVPEEKSDVTVKAAELAGTTQVVQNAVIQTAPVILPQLPKEATAAPTQAMALERSLQKPLLESSLPSIESQLEPQLAPQLAPQAKLQQAAPQEQSALLNLDAELGAAVGFTADQATQQSNKDMLAKLKAFDVDSKNLSSNKTQSFEQNILSRLKNEQLMSAVPVASQSLSDSNQFSQSQNQSQSHSQNESGLGHQGFNRVNDLKTEALDVNQLHQATGQSHSQTHNEFKTQLSLAPAAQDHSLAKLDESREANINEIMNQAQYLVKKGGGEVSVKMSPEGMGDVHLKVMLQDGKLNIELQTQNKDVKKLIEDSLSELKSGLSAHRLSLEHVKIDTVNATNADNNTQFQSNLNQGNSEGRTREFWNDFQGNMNNQSGKKSSYAGSSGQPNVSSRDSATSAASAASALRTYGGTKGATINRVA